MQQSLIHLQASFGRLSEPLYCHCYRDTCWNAAVGVGVYRTASGHKPAGFFWCIVVGTHKPVFPLQELLFLTRFSGGFGEGAGLQAEDSRLVECTWVLHSAPAMFTPVSGIQRPQQDELIKATEDGGAEKCRTTVCMCKYTSLHHEFIFSFYLLTTCKEGAGSQLYANQSLRNAVMWKPLLQIHSDKDVRRQEKKNPLKAGLQSSVCYRYCIFVLHYYLCYWKPTAWTWGSHCASQHWWQKTFLTITWVI